MSSRHRNEAEPHRGFDLELWKKLFRYVRPYRRDAALLVLFAALTASTELAFPVLIGKVIDEAGRHVESGGLGGTVAGLRAYGWMLLTLSLTLAVCVASFIRVGSRIRTHVSHDIRRDGFRNLQRLSFSYFDHRPVGWLMARMTSDCERLSNVVAWGTLDVVWGGTLMGGIAIVMLVYDVKLALCVLAILPVLAWASQRFQHRILTSSREVRRTNSKLTAAYNEALLGVTTSKVFTREQADLKGFRVQTGAMRSWSVRNALESALFLPVVLTLGSLATGSALVAGGVEVLGAQLTLGTLVTFMVYTRNFFGPVEELAYWFSEMQMAQASAERILGLIETEPAIQDSPEVRAAASSGTEPEGVGTIRFEHVGFAYENGRTVLQDFDLTVAPGETIALVGSTGGGKSTIVNLLCRFYEPTSGAIRFDGVDYRQRGLHWLQSQLGIVLQQPHLFSGTVLENIRYGNLEATDEEVEQAARLVGAHEFIAAMEHGYASEVGEGGTLLSTGQKQLVSFARAILARPALLVMDEATSSIDTETEARIQAALDQVLTGRTCFVIAHRLSTIRSADRILVIDRGRIAELGTHAELMAVRGKYFELYTQQSLNDRVRFGSGESAGVHATCEGLPTAAV